MKLTLPDTIASRQDLSSLLLEIRNYNKWLNHESVKNKVTRAPIAPAPALTEAGTVLLRSLSAQKRLTPEGIDELLRALETHKKTAPSITMTLAGLPPQTLKNELVAWCRTNLHPAIMINFNVNSTLLGGMVVRYGSRVFDWSFRRQILTSADTFPEVLRRV